MAYYLGTRGWGRNFKAQGDYLELATRADSPFWEENIKNWVTTAFSKQLRKGDIIVSAILYGWHDKKYRGRIVGYYEVCSEPIYEPLRVEGFPDNIDCYVKVKNLCQRFSELSKNHTILKSKDYIEFKGGTILKGYKKLDDAEAKKIILDIEKYRE